MEANNALIKAIREKRFSDFRQQLDELYNYVVQVEKTSDKALATVRDWNKDAEIQKLQQEVEELRSKIYNDFTLTAEEHNTVSAWKRSHREKEHRGRHSGYWTFEFTPTELGTIGYCVCESCREKFMFREP